MFTINMQNSFRGKIWNDITGNKKMRYNYILLIMILFSTDSLRSQGSQQFGKIFKKSENQAPVANAGEDVKVPPGTTITISGEKSGDPNGDVLQFEWSLPPSLMQKDN